MSGKPFFFQAEVGMRVIGVTGVQTCALPISVLSRSAHDRSHLTRLLPDPTGGRPVRVLTVDERRTVPVEEAEGGPRLLWEERVELPEGAIYLGEADGVPYAAVRGERRLTLGGRSADTWAGLRDLGADLD